VSKFLVTIPGLALTFETAQKTLQIIASVYCLKKDAFKNRVVMSNICFYWLGSLVTSLTLKIQLISAVPHLVEQKEQLKSRAEIINQRISSGLFTDIASINSQLNQLSEDINKLEAINSEAKASKDVI